MPYDYIEEYQKQDDETIWLFHDKDAQEKIDTSLTETDYANPLTLETMQAQLAKNTKIKIEPIQDLHGYDKPWVGGAGKNFLSLTVEGIKSINTSGTWSGNAYFLNGITFTILTDSDNNVIGINANGTPISGVTYFVLSNSFDSTSNAGRMINGLPFVGSTTTIEFRISDQDAWTSIQDILQDSPIIDNGTNLRLGFRVASSYLPNNLNIYPMIRLSTESDATFEPYTNICPISGHDQIDILGCGKNLWTIDHIADISDNTDYELSDTGIRVYSTGSYSYRSVRAYIDDIPQNKTLTFSFSMTETSGQGAVGIQGSINGIDYENISATAVGNDRIFNSASYKMLRFQFFCTRGTTTSGNVTYSNLQLEINSNSTSYEPYTISNNLSIDLPSTVYGGVLDLESGELVVDSTIVTENDFVYGGSSSSGGLSYFNIPTNYPSTLKKEGYCSHLVYANSGWGSNTPVYCTREGSTEPFFPVRIYDDSTNLADFKTKYAGLQVVYELSTPFTLQLTPHQLSLLKAQNNLTTSQYTQIKVTYRNGVFATLEPASEDNDGLMSRLDKVKLDSIADDATKTESSTINGNIKINGTETQVYDDSEIKEELSTDTTTIEGNPLNFTTLSAQKSKSTIIDIEPIQDLHGFTKPWVGDAGKNLAGITNTSFSTTGLSITPEYDTDGNFIDLKIIADGTRSVDTYYWVTDHDPGFWAPFLNKTLKAYTWGMTTGLRFELAYKVNDGDTLQYGLRYTDENANGTYTITLGSSYYTLGYRIRVAANAVVNTTLKMMIVESSTTVTSFEPYENICPISGRSEIGISLQNWFLVSIVSGKTIEASGVVTDNDYRSCNIEYNKILPNTRYNMSYNPTNLDYGAFFYESTNESSFISYISWTDQNNSILTPSNANYVRFAFKSITPPTNVKLELTGISSTDLTINLGQAVYGGTLDVENGVLVVDKGKKKVSDLSWEDATSQDKYRYKATLADVYPVPIRTLKELYCEKYETISDGRVFGDTPYYCIYTDEAKIIYIQDMRYSTVTDFTTNEANTEIVYKLSTPITLQLTPNEISLLEGVNNISILDDNASAKLTYRNGSVAMLADLLNLEKKLTDEEPYGFIEHMSILDPAQRIEYIGKNKNYSPMTINLAGDHLANYNEWYDFPVIKENKPYMIKADGTVDYALDPNDYTKKFDGSASDVANTSYTGGVFAWIPKTYKREFTVGDDRYVYISTKKLSDEYEAIGFIDENGLEHDGAWIPMFYGTEITQDGIVKIMTLATGAPTQNRNTDTQKTYLTNANPDTLFFGGPIVKVLTDIMIMLGKNSDVSAVFGTGNMSGGNGAQYMKDNACIDGGAFYGTTTNNVLNKAFHSLVLLTQNQWQRDPYTLNIQGEYIVSPYYKYDLTGDSYVKTGVFVTPPSSNNWVYPHKSISVPHWGAEPVGPYSGSTTTGWADGQYTLANQLTDTTVRVVQRFAYCAGGRAGGLRAVGLGGAASGAHWYLGASPLLLSKGTAPQ